MRAVVAFAGDINLNLKMSERFGVKEVEQDVMLYFLVSEINIVLHVATL